MKPSAINVLALVVVSAALTACGGAGQPTEVPTVAPPRLPATPGSYTPTAESVPSPSLIQVTVTPEAVQPSPTVGATAEPTAAATPIPTKAPPTGGLEAEVEIKVAEYNTFTDSYGDLHVVGLVTNDTGSDLSDAVVRATLLDASGDEVASGDATVLLVGLPKGGSLPFEAIVPSPPEYKEIKFSAEAQRADPQAMPINQLAVEAATIVKGEEGYVVRGQVRNLSTAPVNMVSVAVLIRDGSGKLIGVASTDLSDPLGPQATAPFEIEVPELGGEPTKLDFRAEGYP